MNTAKIDVTKLKKEWFFRSPKGAVYCDLVLFKNQDGPDKYGNTHVIKQSVPKEQRLKGEKGQIVGNAKIEGDILPNTSPEALETDSSSDEVPF